VILNSPFRSDFSNMLLSCTEPGCSVYTSINIFLRLQTLCRITEKYEFLLKNDISCSDGALIGRCVPAMTPTIAVDVLNGCWSVARRGQFTLW
jgi:hypothetical protein